MKQFRSFFALVGLILTAPVSAQSLTVSQLTSICTVCKASAACNTPRIAGDTITLLTWLNTARTPTILAWRVDMQSQELDEAANYTLYDGLTAGKRDEWAIFLRFPRSMARNKNRGVVTDVWGAATANSVAEGILQASTYPATNAQNALGGTSKTTGTVTASDLNYTGLANMLDATWLVQPANCQ
jgi:hypothetical protein